MDKRSRVTGTTAASKGGKNNNKPAAGKEEPAPVPTQSTASLAAAGAVAAVAAEDAEQQRCLVFCRVRPLLSVDDAPAAAAGGAKAAKGAVAAGPTTWIEVHGGRNVVGNGKAYVFDKAFNEFTSQETIFRETSAACVQHCLAGYRASVVAYGQTGSGKTFTLCQRSSAPAGSPLSESAGVIHRAAHALFSAIEDDAQRRYTVDVEFVEIYRDYVRDLLVRPPGSDAAGNNAAGAAALALRDPSLNDPLAQAGVAIQFEASSGVTLGGVVRRSCANAQQLVDTFDEGFRRRVTAATQMNAASSRGHVALLVWVSSRNEATGDERIGKLTIVDLAGYEQLTKTGISTTGGSDSVGTAGANANGPQRFHEAKTINASLLALGKVVRTLSSKHQQHVPWRDAKLTRLLQDSIGGANRTTIILTISPSSRHVHETTNTLQFGHAAMGVKVEAYVNEVVDYKRLANRLQSLLDAKEGRIGELETKLSVLEAQREDLVERQERDLQELRREHEADLTKLKVEGANDETVAKLEQQHRVETENFVEQQMQERVNEAERREEVALASARYEVMLTSRRAAAETTDLMSRIQGLERTVRELRAENEELRKQAAAASDKQQPQPQDQSSSHPPSPPPGLIPSTGSVVGQQHHHQQVSAELASAFAALGAVTSANVQADPDAATALIERLKEQLDWCERDRDAHAEAAMELKLQLDDTLAAAIERGDEIERLQMQMQGGGGLAGLAAGAAGEALLERSASSVGFNDTRRSEFMLPLVGGEEEDPKLTAMIQTSRGRVRKVDKSLLDAARAEIQALAAELAILRGTAGGGGANSPTNAGSPLMTDRGGARLNETIDNASFSAFMTPRGAGWRSGNRNNATGGGNNTAASGLPSDASVPSIVPRLQLPHITPQQMLNVTPTAASGLTGRTTYRHQPTARSPMSTARNPAALGSNTARTMERLGAVARVHELEAANAELAERLSLLESELVVAVEALQAADRAQEQQQNQRRSNDLSSLEVQKKNTANDNDDDASDDDDDGSSPRLGRTTTDVGAASAHSVPEPRDEACQTDPVPAAAAAAAAAAPVAPAKSAGEGNSGGVKAALNAGPCPTCSQRRMRSGMSLVLAPCLTIIGCFVAGLVLKAWGWPV